MNAEVALGRAEQRHLRLGLGKFATGVTVVTYRDGEEARGATVNSFTSVSMSPPLVLVSIARTARACAGLEGSPFAINVLRAEQLDLARHFAGSVQGTIDIPWVQTGPAPRLRGSLAWFECEAWQSVDAGDHVLFIGQVLAHDRRAGEPLIFQGGQFRRSGGLLIQSPNPPSDTGWESAEWQLGPLARAHQAEVVEHSALTPAANPGLATTEERVR